MRDGPVDGQIDKMVREMDFTLHGWSALQPSISMEFYRTWIESGLGGEMAYLENHLTAKADPTRLLPNAKSMIVLAQNYFPHPEDQGFPLKDSRVAMYARGTDYHFWFKEKINNLIHQLKIIFPREEFLSFVDSGPILERDFAYRAGLGWVGKNTCLIDEKKCVLCLLGDLLARLESQATATPAADRCGTCTRCSDICPTQALVEPRKMDARKCISYLTIESKKVPDEKLRAKMTDWLYGCDLCQTVCPWNQKIWKEKLSTSSMQAKTQQTANELKWILNSSNKELQKTFKKTPLSRAAGKGLKRNAIIVATNLGLKELRPDIQKLNANSYFSELCQWSEKTFDSKT